MFKTFCLKVRYSKGYDTIYFRKHFRFNIMGTGHVKIGKPFGIILNLKNYE